MLSLELFLLLDGDGFDFVFGHAEENAHIFELALIIHLKLLLLLLELHFNFPLVLVVFIFFICVDFFLLVVGSSTKLVLFLDVMGFKIVHLIVSDDFGLWFVVLLGLLQWILIFVVGVLDLA